MRCLKTFPLIVLLSTFSLHVSAQYLVKDATVTKVGSANWDEKVFYIVVEGGSGTCANATINFPEEYAHSIVAYAQMQNIALLAYLNQKRVSVYNYGAREYKKDDVCTGANQIAIYD